MHNTLYPHPLHHKGKVFGRLLKSGEVLVEGDLESTDKGWEPVPAVDSGPMPAAIGDTLQPGHEGRFVRPAKCTTKVPVRHVPKSEVVTDPDTEIDFLRTSCTVCQAWIGDSPISV